MRIATDFLRRATGNVSHFVRHHVLAIGAALLVAAIYAIPQVIYLVQGHAGAVLVQPDETFYVARLVRALQGVDARCPFLYEHRHGLSLVPGFVERGLAAPFRFGVALGLACPSPDAVVIFYRALLAFLGVLAAAFALTSTGLPSKLAVLAAFWAYVDPGILAYKPLVGFLLNGPAFNRLTNPLVGLPIFFVAWACLARAILDRERMRTAVVVSGVAGGLLFYVSFYYWTLFVAIAVISVFFEWRRRYLVIAIVLGIAAIASVGYWPYAISFRGSPYYADILWRTDFHSHGRGVCFAPNKTMWLFVLAALSLWRVSVPRARFLVTSILAGFGCFYSSLVTGMDFPNSMENSHWTVALAPMVLGATLWRGYCWLGGERYVCWRSRIGVGLGAVLVLGGTLASVRLSRNGTGEGAGALDPAYGAAWTWLRKNGPMDAVVMADEGTMGHVPLRAGNYVWINELVYPDAVSFEEILDRYRVLWALKGTSVSELEQMFASRFDGPRTWLWAWGLTPSLARDLRDDGWPPLDPLRWRSFVRGIVDAVDRTTAEEVQAIGRRYRLDYILRGPNESLWTNVENHLLLTPVFQAQGVRIDRVDGWRLPAPSTRW